MLSSRFLVASLLTVLVSFQATAAEPTQDNQVKLMVVKYHNHIQVECSPANADTSTRSDWKTTCNEMAASQVEKLAEDGVIAPLAGPVFDVSDTAAQALSKSIALSQEHL
jgi:hypothetical protein